MEHDDATDVSSAARALAQHGASKGGRARASVLTAEERSDQARQAARARWGNKKPPRVDSKVSAAITPAKPSDDVPYSAFPGTLQMGSITLECHVLNDGRSVLTAREVVKALRGTSSSPPSIQRYLERLPGYEAGMFDDQTVNFRIPGIPNQAIGFDATVLIEICNLYLAARDEKKLKPGQGKLAKSAEIIIRSSAKVGIIALIHEATGYQQVREKRALQVKLQAFIAEEMQEWVATFPEEFWQELARLEGIRYQARHRPLRWGGYVMRFVYDSIDPDLGRKLREINPNPHHRKNHHQWLREYGRDKLHRQIGGVIAVMRDCRDMKEFRNRFERVFDRKDQMSLDLDWASLN